MESDITVDRSTVLSLSFMNRTLFPLILSPKSGSMVFLVEILRLPLVN